MKSTGKNYKMLNYSKTILAKMAFDRALLAKEYRKCLRWLDNEESRELKTWMESERLIPVYSMEEVEQ